MAKTDLQSLPSFEGRKPDTLDLNITGGVEFDRAIAEAHGLDDTVYMVVCAQVSKVAHSTDKDGAMARVETCKVDTLAIWSDDATDEAAQLISRLNREARSRKGIEEFPGL